MARFGRTFPLKPHFRRTANAPAASSGFVAYSGVGSATFVGTTLAKTSTVISAAGTFAPHGAAIAKGAVAFAGSGSLAPHGSETAKASTQFSGVGTLAPAGATKAAGHASFAGSGSLSAAGATIARALVAFAGLGHFAPVGVSLLPGAVTFRGTGALNVATASRFSGAAMFAGGGVFAPVGAVGGTVSGAVAFAGSGAFAPASPARTASTGDGMGYLFPNPPEKKEKPKDVLLAIDGHVRSIEAITEFSTLTAEQSIAGAVVSRDAYGDRSSIVADHDPDLAAFTAFMISLAEASDMLEEA